MKHDNRDKFVMVQGDTKNDQKIIQSKLSTAPTYTLSDGVNVSVFPPRKLINANCAVCTVCEHF